MSNQLHLNGLTYFQVPKSIFDPGRCKALGNSAFMLYAYVCYLSQERSKVNVFIGSDELKRVLSFAKGTVLNARAVLEAEGLIKFTRGSAGYTYLLCNPETGKPLQNSVKGDFEPLDLDKLNRDQLRSYYVHHVKGSVEQTEKGIRVCCPFHNDSNPSLDIMLCQGSLWHCHRCGVGGKLIEFETRMAKLNSVSITPSEAQRRIRGVLVKAGAIDATLGLPEATYRYTDADGKLLYEVLRYTGKKFKQRRPNPDKPGHYVWNITGVKRVLYCLPEVIKAETVILLEGEKDCDNLRLLGLMDESLLPVAISTCAMGSAGWRHSYAQSLERKRVVIFPDQDFAGRRHGRNVAESLKACGADVRICEFPSGFKDMTDFLGEHGAADLAHVITDDWISVPTAI